MIMRPDGALLTPSDLDKFTLPSEPGWVLRYDYDPAHKVKHCILSIAGDFHGDNLLQVDDGVEATFPSSVNSDPSWHV